MDFCFIPHVVDTSLPDANYAQAALADVNNDGHLEYIVGQQYGDIFWYKVNGPDAWTRHLLGRDSPSDVGGIALDVDGDGWMDFVTGGAWYRNSRSEGEPFTRMIFDPELTGVHDILAADINGDGRVEVLTMSDQNDLRWYAIPEDPTSPWPVTHVWEAVHAGISVGDINGSGHLDIVRTDIWLENVTGDGIAWIAHAIGPNSPPPADFRPYFAFDATHNVVLDMNGNGFNDIVFTDAEIPGGKVWWVENTDGTGDAWRRRCIYLRDPATEPRRGAYHSLYCGDIDGDGDIDVLSCEMEAVGGEAPPRWYVWENVDGKGLEWREHVILDANLGGHATVVGDITGNGLLDVVSKPWRAQPTNAVGGKTYICFLENVSSG